MAPVPDTPPAPYEGITGYIAQIKTPDASAYLLKDSELRSQFSSHQSNTTIHTDSAEKATWNAKADISDIPTTTSQLTNNGSDGTAQYLEDDEDAYRTSSIPYGACDSTSQATAFTATVPGITELRDGVCMLLKNGVITSTTNFTININGLGAKPVYNNMAAATRDTTIFNANYTMLFIYDSTRVSGGCWICYRGYNSDNNTIGYQIRTNSGSLPMKSAVYRYRILFTAADGKYFVPANNSTSTNATASRAVCQDKIDPFGRIVYYGATTAIAADSRPGATALWDQYGITFGYSFNRTGAALTLTSWKPIYIKCAPQSDGSAIIDSTTPYVQDLPTSEDGKIYIFLGIAYSATAVELMIHHPVYWYHDGAVRLWTSKTTKIYHGDLYIDSPFSDDGATISNTDFTIFDLVNSFNKYDNIILRLAMSVGVSSDSSTYICDIDLPMFGSTSTVNGPIGFVGMFNAGDALTAWPVVVIQYLYYSGGDNWSTSIKAIQPFIDEARITDWDTAYSDSHTHSNKSVLDGISASDVSAWNAKQNALTEGTDYLNKTHLDAAYVALSSVGANSGVAELDSTGKVPTSQLPSYVDDVVEYASLSNFPATGESGKIYIAIDTNLTYRWGGTEYVNISSSLALGETSSTAYRGDRGKIAYDHSQNGDVHVTTTQKTNWNTAYTNSHTHANKSLLDSYDQTNADISDAVSKKHTHSNKTVLDGIASTDITAWNGKYTKPSTGIPSTDLATAVQTSLGLADTAVQDASYVHTDNNYTTTDKNKLAGIAAGAEVNVQADWNQTTTTAADYIKNKPSIPTATTTTPKMDGTAAVGTETTWAKGDHVHPVDTSRAAASDLTNHTGNTTVHITATERTNWNTAYTDAHTHSNKTVLDGISSTDISNWNAAEPNVQADWSVTDSTSDAFIKSKPTIPTSLSELTSDSSHRTVTDAQISAWNSGGFTDEIVLIDVSLKRYDTHRFRIASASV